MTLVCTPYSTSRDQSPTRHQRLYLPLQERQGQETERIIHAGLYIEELSHKESNGFAMVSRGICVRLLDLSLYPWQGYFSPLLEEGHE